MKKSPRGKISTGAEHDDATVVEILDNFQFFAYFSVRPVVYLTFLWNSKSILQLTFAIRLLSTNEAFADTRSDLSIQQ